MEGLAFFRDVERHRSRQGSEGRWARATGGGQVTSRPTRRSSLGRRHGLDSGSMPPTAKKPATRSPRRKSSAAPDKGEILQLLRDRLAETLERLTAAQTSAQSGAVHSEAKQEHPKDTRSIEAGYLSRGLAERVETLREAVITLSVFRVRQREEDDPVALGDLVALRDGDGTESVYFLSPVGGGEKIDCSGIEVLVLTARSPLGGALIGAANGDEVGVDLPGGRRIREIAWVR